MGCCVSKPQEQTCPLTPLTPLTSLTPPSPTLMTAAPSPPPPEASATTTSPSSSTATPPSPALSWPWNSPAQPTYIVPPSAHHIADPPLPMPTFHDTCPVGYESDASTAMAEPPSPGSERGEVAWTPPCSTLASFVSSTATTTASLPPAATHDANESPQPAPDVVPALNPLLAAHCIDDIVVEALAFQYSSQDEASTPNSSS